MLKLKLLVATFAVTASLASADEPCTAPESVVSFAKLVESLFNGAEIECDNGNKFSTKDKFECKGAKYVEVKDPKDLTVTSTGEKVFMVSEISEKKGQVVYTEATYESYDAFKSGKEPRKVSVTPSIAASDKSLILYSEEAPKKGSWITSLWFIGEDGKVKGYKNAFEKAVTCRQK